MYRNRIGTYKATPCIHLSSQGHIFIMPIPAYCPVFKSRGVTQKIITVWPADAIPMLQDSNSVQGRRYLRVRKNKYGWEMGKMGSSPHHSFGDNRSIVLEDIHFMHPAGHDQLSKSSTRHTFDLHQQSEDHQV